eukprot:TRINITY_DN1699_c0_g1_i1.p1 TRINITY_DN1699_c0_g1~~TRINITY_DN1699_c0_g1_i1.p1  ORF type:complete len:634 (+),score=114.25 TRINITY_DN1699_c0_g1_i1:489-2390(+)
MKFMKLGAKPDSFYVSEYGRSVSSEVSSDFVIQVNGVRYLLHKFPLLSKCGLLQRLAAEACDSDNDNIELHDFPGGIEAFEFCAKFCYGIIVTISAYNFVVVRCAADYLQMTEAIDKGNLIYKLEIFFSSCILHGWKDSIITLQTTKASLPLSEDLRIADRCINGIADKTLVDPSKVSWSYTYTRGQKERKAHQIESIMSPSTKEPPSRRYKSVPKDWWIEDLAELEIDLFWRVMLVIKSLDRVSPALIGEALRMYAYRWLPGISKRRSKQDPKTENACDSSDDKQNEAACRHKLLLESIVSLLPTEKSSTSCRFLLKLLKAATILGISPSSKTELVRRIGLQLEEASVTDLLIPFLSDPTEPFYDIDLVQSILEHFMMQSQSPLTSPVHQRHKFERRRSRSADLDFAESRRSSSAAHSSKLKVAKLIDGYLAEIARDANLSITKFISLAESIPDFARPVHDDLYRAIDIYLKEHPDLNKSERKRICKLLDCKKLSMEACMHAAQNERLPLRLVVQVLFVEQARAAMSGGLVHDLPSNIKALLSSQEEDSHVVPESATFDQGWDATSHSVNYPKERDGVTLKMRLAEAENEISDTRQELQKNLKLKNICNLPSKPKNFFSKLWSSNKSMNEKI